MAASDAPSPWVSARNTSASVVTAGLMPLGTAAGAAGCGAVSWLTDLVTACAVDWAAAIAANGAVVVPTDLDAVLDCTVLNTACAVGLAAALVAGEAVNWSTG